MERANRWESEDDRGRSSRREAGRYTGEGRGRDDDERRWRPGAEEWRESRGEQGYGGGGYERGGGEGRGERDWREERSPGGWWAGDRERGGQEGYGGRGGERGGQEDYGGRGGERRGREGYGGQGGSMGGYGGGSSGREEWRAGPSGGYGPQRVGSGYGSSGGWQGYGQGAGQPDWQSSSRYEGAGMRGQEWSRGGSTQGGPYVGGGQGGTAMRERHFRGKGPKGYRRSDERIKEDVSECLCDNDELDASNIEVEVNRGTVTLKGSVESRQDKRLAEDLAENLHGVEDVVNQLRVSSRSSSSGEEERTSGSASQSSGSQAGQKTSSRTS